MVLHIMKLNCPQIIKCVCAIVCVSVCVCPGLLALLLVNLVLAAWASSSHGAPRRAMELTQVRAKAVLRQRMW